MEAIPSFEILALWHGSPAFVLTSWIGGAKLKTLRVEKKTGWENGVVVVNCCQNKVALHLPCMFGQLISFVLVAVFSPTFVFTSWVLKARL